MPRPCEDTPAGRPKERLHVGVVTLLAQTMSEVACAVERGSNSRNGRGVLSKGIQRVRQPSGGVQRMGVLGPDNTPARLQCRPEERLRVGVVALLEK